METNVDWNDLSPTEKAESLAKQAADARKEGHDQLAAPLLIQSLNLYRGIGDRANILRTLIRLSYLSGWADFGDGLDMFARRKKIGDEALPIARELGDKSLLAEALGAFSIGQPADAAKAMLEESAALAIECGDKSTLASAYSSMASRAALRGNGETAVSLDEKALALYEEVGDKAGIAGQLFSMSIKVGQPQRRDYLERALELWRELGQKKRMVEVLTLLDSFCENIDLDVTEAYNLEALGLCRGMNNALWAAGRLNRLADIARARGDNSRAEALEAESKSVYEPPPPDPELEEAMKEAFGSGDVAKMEEAVKRMVR